MTGISTHHIGRSFADTHLEGKCPCPKAACGLVPRDQVVEECGQHHWTAAKTIRQSHPAEECPGAPAEADPLTDQLLDEIEACVNGPLGTATDFDHTTVAPLVAEVRRLRAQAAGGRVQAWRDIADRADPAKPEISWFGDFGHQVGEWIRKQAEYEQRRVAGPAAAVVVSSAVEEQPAVAASEACGKCKQAFDPTDTSFDGRARYHLTPYCRGCVDRCHDTEIADHRCVICA